MLQTAECCTVAKGCMQNADLVGPQETMTKGCFAVIDRFLLFCLLAVFVMSNNPTWADESTEKKSVSDSEIKQYVDDLSRDRRLITSLKIRQANGRLEYDITSVRNPDRRGWVVLVNLSDAVFRENSEKYEADGYKMSVHEVITINRRKRHSAVWVQDVQAAETLVLPTGAVPESIRTGGSRFKPLKAMMRQAIKDHNLPGGTIAVSHHGKLIFEGGFGYADIEQKAKMPADANMRIASISKCITAVAVLILAQDNRLQLDMPVLECLSADGSQKFETQKALEKDPRWAKITIRQLLQHSGGWDRDLSDDTVFRLPEISQSLQLKHLARADDIVRYQLTQPLDFDPGSRYSYSNVGYCLLGRIIERVSGKTYADFVHERILVPAKMTQTRLGKTRLTDRAPDEVHYYTQTLTRTPAVWDRLQKRAGKPFELVPGPYGQWDLEAMDSLGGWTSTASDLVRFVDAIDRTESPLLTDESRQQMQKPPSFFDPSSADVWYGLGWNVRQAGGRDGRNRWHTGSLAGTSTLLVRRHDGYSWAVLFNIDKTVKGERCTSVIDSEIHRAIAQSASE
jgi:N-acyl-D-amino-acid deacylase